MIWEKCFACLANHNGPLSAILSRLDAHILKKLFILNSLHYNPDTNDPVLNSELGVYKPHCGLRNVTMSWGHDEYVYQMMKDSLPEPGLYMLRYHSFYAWHREGAYDYLLDDHDREMLKWVKLFNPYDLYSKNPVPPIGINSNLIMKIWLINIFLQHLNFNLPDQTETGESFPVHKLQRADYLVFFIYFIVVSAYGYYIYHKKKSTYDRFQRFFSGRRFTYLVGHRSITDCFQYFCRTFYRHVRFRLCTGTGYFNL